MPKMCHSGKYSDNFEIIFYTLQRIEIFPNFPKKNSCNSFQCFGHVNSVTRQNCATTFGQSHSFVYFTYPISAPVDLESPYRFFSFYFLLLLWSWVHQWFDPGIPNWETDDLTTEPWQVEDEVILCIYILHFWSIFFKGSDRFTMMTSRGIWSWSSHLWHGRLNHCAIGTAGWSNFLYIYFIFMINLV